MKKWENTKAYRELAKDLRESLEVRGLREKVYRDKVDEYLSLWVQFQKLKADVEENGVTLFDQKRGMNVENRSVSMGIQVSRQMLNIYAALGFKEISAGGKVELGEDDEL